MFKVVMILVCSIARRIPTRRSSRGLIAMTANKPAWAVGGRLVLECAILAALFLGVAAERAAAAQDQVSGYPYPELDPRGHEQLRPFHDIVSTWRDKDGKSCCNEGDCHIVDDYVVGTNKLTGEEEYSVHVFGRWWKVPQAAVRPYT